MKVLSVLDHSLPSSDGYAIRAMAVLRCQSEIGIQPVALTSAYQPSASIERSEEFHGIVYHRTGAARVDLPILHEYASVGRLRSRISELISREKPDILHAHSPCLWGLATLKVARRHGLPFVFEIRSFWEDSAVDQGKTSYGSLRYRLTRWLETHVVRQADAVVTIGERMKDELVGRGIDRRKIFVVPNGIDTSRFQQMAPDAQLVEELGLNDCVTLGYIGSLYPWEGVDELLRAMPTIVEQLSGRAQRVKLLIVGGGEEENSLRQRIAELKLHDVVRILGRVPNESIERYYSLLDVLVYPRPKTRLTELVTPLKPLEAMAMGKAVVASDVGGLRELIGDDNGLFYRPGDPRDLAECCVNLVADPNRRLNFGEKAKKYARSKRDWRRIVPMYRKVYDFAIQQAGVARTDSGRPPVERVREVPVRDSVGV